jgi:hypothetical protein
VLSPRGLLQRLGDVGRNGFGSGEADRVPLRDRAVDHAGVEVRAPQSRMSLICGEETFKPFGRWCYAEVPEVSLAGVDDWDAEFLAHRQVHSMLSLEAFGIVAEDRGGAEQHRLQARLFDQRMELPRVRLKGGLLDVVDVRRSLTDCEDRFLKDASHLIVDRDNSFLAMREYVEQNTDTTIVLLPPKSPNLNAFMERWFRSLKSESLSRMIFFGKRSLERAVAEIRRALPRGAESSGTGERTHRA